MKQVEEQAVDHPVHYNAGKIEVIEFLEDQKLDFHLGNAVKYICRSGKKVPDKSSPVERLRLERQDLGKAIWYLNRKLKQLETESLEFQVAPPFQSVQPADPLFRENGLPFLRDTFKAPPKGYEIWHCPSHGYFAQHEGRLSADCPFQGCDFWLKRIEGQELFCTRAYCTESRVGTHTEFCEQHLSETKKLEVQD